MDARAAPGDGLSRRHASWIVAGLLLLTVALRFTGIGFLLPHQPEPDAVVVWQAAWLDRPEGAPPSDTVYLAPFYPYLLAYLLAALPGHSYRELLAPDAPLDAHLAAVAEPYLRGRILIAALSLLAVLATYRMARSFLPRAPACLATAFAATSLMAASYAQQARPHAASAALSAVAVVLALRHLRRGGWESLASASLGASAALACLHNGVFVLPGLLLAWWFAPGRRWVQLVVPGAAIAATLLVFYPFLFERGVVSQTQSDTLDIGGQTLTWEQISLQGLPQIVRGLWSFDPVLVGCAGAGIAALLVALARGRGAPPRRPLLVAALFPIGFIAFWSVMQVVWPRFTNPLVPPAAVLAAGGVHAAVAWLAPAHRRARAFALASLAVLSVPAFASAWLVALRARADTQELAARWLEAAGDRARDVVALNFLLPLPVVQTHASVEALPTWARGPWEQYQLDLPESGGPARWRIVPVYSHGALADKRIDRDEVLEVVRAGGCTLGVATIQTARGRGRDETRDALNEIAGPPAASFLPFDPALEDLHGSGYELGWHAFERVVRSRLWGPPVECFRIDPR